MRLTERQYIVLTFLQSNSGGWAGAFNKKVWTALVEKGLAIVDKNYNLKLTKAGKEWRSPKSIKL